MYGGRSDFGSANPSSRQFMAMNELNGASSPIDQSPTNRAISTVGAESTAASMSSARNLISMFESKRSNTSAIFPPGEHWQYTGNLAKSKGRK